ncbi:hypothetical protein RFI_05978, partial [Reticulomyxa filosa]
KKKKDDRSMNTPMTPESPQRNFQDNIGEDGDHILPDIVTKQEYDNDAEQQHAQIQEQLQEQEQEQEQGNGNAVVRTPSSDEEEDMQMVD